MNDELIDWARKNNLLGGLLTLKTVKDLVDEKERRIKELETTLGKMATEHNNMRDRIVELEAELGKERFRYVELASINDELEAENKVLAESARKALNIFAK